MNKIKAKQVDGIVDNSSRQPISGEKTFIDMAVFEDKTEQNHVVIKDGFIYWVINPENLNEAGNIRQGVVSGSLTNQVFINDVWTNESEK